MSKLKLFLILASALLISCNPTTGPEDQGTGGGGNGGGGTGTGGGAGGGGTGNPSWFLTADQQSKPLNKRVVLKKTKSGEYYRIPGIVVTDKNTIIVVFDNRKGSNADIGFANAAGIEPTVMRSTDGGETWGTDIRVGEAATDKNNAHGDPVIFKANNGDIVVLAAAGGAWATAPGSPSKISVSISKDDGLSWSNWKEVQEDIFSKQLKNLTGSPSSVNTYFSKGFAASGRGTTLSDGTLACTMLIGSDNGSSMKGAATLYSKDNGQSWKLGGWIQYPGNSYDEPKIVGQLTDGRILMTARPNSANQNRFWAVANSVTDNWVKYADVNLIDGRANAEGVRYTLKSEKHSKDRLLFLNCYGNGRKNLTLHMSEDEGKTWPTRLLLQSGSSCYSSIDVLGDGTIVIFAEEPNALSIKDTYDLVFRRVNLYDLTQGKQVYSDTW